jgi:hypothetical protein
VRNLDFFDTHDKTNNVRTNGFVHMTGTIEKVGMKKYINVANIHPIEDSIEPYHHCLYVMMTQTLIEKGPVSN